MIDRVVIDNEDLALLSAYIDGELAGKTANALRERLIRDPALRSELENLQKGDTMLRDFASQIDDRHVPAAMLSATSPEPNSPEAFSSEPISPQRKRLQLRVYATAASVLLLVAAGVLLVPSQTSEFAVLDELGLIESGERVATPTGYLEVVASFYHQDGRVCREFATEQAQGIACLDRTISGDWQEILVVPSNRPAEGTYQPAGVSDLASLDEYIAKNIDGEVLGLTEERQLILNNWQQ